MCGADCRLITIDLEFFPRPPVQSMEVVWPTGGRTCPAEGVGLCMSRSQKKRCAANLWIGCSHLLYSIALPHARHRDGHISADSMSGGSVARVENPSLLPRWVSCEKQQTSKPQ